MKDAFFHWCKVTPREDGDYLGGIRLCKSCMHMYTSRAPDYMPLGCVLCDAFAKWHVWAYNDHGGFHNWHWDRTMKGECVARSLHLPRGFFG